MKQSIVLVVILVVVCGASAAQIAEPAMPAALTIARHTFFDFGPPNDFYEILRVVPSANQLSIERALITPQGMSCLQPARIEIASGILQESMEGLLQSKNPCAIAEKELRRERARCKNCIVFSGVNVTMQMNCGGKDRQIGMDILDRDLFGFAPGTPSSTSWSMAVLQKLDAALPPGVMDRPIFSVETAHSEDVPVDDLTDRILNGSFDPLFGTHVKVSAIAQDAAKGHPPPSVQIEYVSPVAPISVELPKYPPIAGFARAEGLVEVTFDVDLDGVIRNISFPGESRLRLLQPTVSESLFKWKFPQAAWGKRETATIRFQLNCNPTPPKS
jgi:hypothetical protein